MWNNWVCIYVYKSQKLGEDLEGENEERNKQTLGRNAVIGSFSLPAEM